MRRHLQVKDFPKDGTEWFIREDIRNVLIYFDVATERQILKNIRSMMSPQGYLILGAAETTMGPDDQFGRVQAEKGVGDADVSISDL